MNAIISLCHFCEIHGPAVVFCTQAFHSPELEQECNENAESDVKTARYSQGPPPNSWDCLRESWNAENRTTVTSLSAPSSPTSACPEKAKIDHCEACTPFTSSRPGFISRDAETRVCYVSSDHPRNSEVFSIVRQACIRSLSCEVCPGREGPIFFGDDHRSQVLSHTFFIKDSLARGFQRLYSITVVMMDKIFLLNSWPFLVKHIQKVIDFLKTKSDAVHTEEIARCPQRSQRIASTCPSASARNFRLHSGSGNRPTRSLAELTNDVRVFECLHRAFTWLLKAGGDRLTEKLLEGPPTEGCIVDINHLEETEEGFVKVFSRKGVTVDQTMHRDVDLDDATLPASTTKRFTQLKNLVKAVGYNRFGIIAHHILIGNQLIVRSSSPLIVHAIIDCLKILLPKGCCRTVYYSNEYIPSYKCNFLGVDSAVKIPMDTALCVVVNVTDLPQMTSSVGDGQLVPDLRSADELLETGVSSSGPHSLLLSVGDTEAVVNFSHYYYSVVHSAKALPPKEPTLLNKIEKTLKMDNLADVVLEQSLICLKEDWMNKVKRMFMFTKVGCSRSKEETDKLMQVIGAQEQDKMVLKFWMSGLSVEYQLNTNCGVDALAAADTK